MSGFLAITGSKLRKNIDHNTILRYFNKQLNTGMRKITFIILVIFLSNQMVMRVYSQEKISITKVVIDAGHGGKDPGTIGKKSQEKNVTLQIALKLSEMIRSQCKDVTVICTRTTDEFIELHERAEIANRSKADLFISIHCNSNPKRIFQGVETYVMGLHRTEANLEIAKKENASILMETDYSTNYNGFDPNSDESYITFTLFQNAFLEQSTWFASIVQDEMKDRVGMNDRGVRQAGFLVLYKTTMPSVLIETGFLSNTDEEKFLTSEKGQQYIASAICRSFQKFKAKMEGNGKELAALYEKKKPSSKIITTSPEVPKLTDTAKEETKKGLDKDTVTPKENPAKNPSIKQTSHGDAVPVRIYSKEYYASHKVTENKKKTGGNTTLVDIEKTKSRPEQDASKKDTLEPKEKLPTNNVNHDKAKGKIVKKETEKPEVVTKSPVMSANEVVFRVQIATSPKELSVHSKKFEGLPEIWSYQHQGSYKYTTGKESTTEALSGLVAKAKKAGFTDAFVVAFNGDERITIAEAKKMISELKHK